MLLPPQTQSLTGHPHVQLSLLQHLWDATLLHVVLLFMTQNLPSKVFPPATFTLPPPPAFPVLLFLLSFLLHFQLTLFPPPPPCLFLTPSPPVSLSPLTLCLACLSTCSP